MNSRGQSGSKSGAGPFADRGQDSGRGEQRRRRYVALVGKPLAIGVGFVGLLLIGMIVALVAVGY